MTKFKDMKFVIGVDSGGTHYRIKACDLSGKCLGYTEGAPANHHYLNPEEMKLRIESSLTDCLGQFGGRIENLCMLVCGTTGIDSKEDYRRLMELYTGIGGSSCPVILMNDAELALTQAKLNLNQSIYNYMVAKSDMEKVLGQETY